MKRVKTYFLSMAILMLIGAVGFPSMILLIDVSLWLSNYNPSFPNMNAIFTNWEGAKFLIIVWSLMCMIVSALITFIGEPNTK